MNPRGEDDAGSFVDELWHKIVENDFIIGGRPDQKVIEFIQPNDVSELLALEIGKTGTNKREMLEMCEKFIKYSVKTGHPHFFNQLHSAPDTYSFGGSILSDALNTELCIHEMAPAFTLIENYMIEKIGSIIGFKGHDGITIAGGSLANMMALHLARYRYENLLKLTGHFGNKRLTMFCSEDAHYSLQKGAAFLGFGTDSLVLVKVDSKGKMNSADLESKIIQSKAEGNIPLFVLATEGTTVLGAFDPINEIADICEKYGLWLHADAAFGGCVLLTKDHKSVFNGIHRVDSFNWNFHKVMRTTIQCSMFLVRQRGLLSECNGIKDGLSLQSDGVHDTSHELCDKTILDGKKCDSFKLWVQWKARGDEGMGWPIEKSFQNATYLTERLRTNEAYRLVMPKFECLTVCFWYIPPSHRGQEETDEWWQKMDKVAPAIKRRMMTEGTIMIGHQPLPSLGFVNFFRIVICNPELTYKDMDFVIEEINRLGHDL